MSGPQWTAGPWGFHGDCGEVFREDGDVRPLIATVDYDNCASDQTYLADGHLIAAAPDLYAALEAMVIAEVDYMTINKLGDPEKQHNVKVARAALSRARGETT